MTMIIGVFDAATGIDPVRQALIALGCGDGDVFIHKGTDAEDDLSDLGFEGEELAELRDELERGRIVVTVEVAEDQADDGLDTLRRHGALPGRDEDEDEDEGRRIPEVEEDVSIGKRASTRGVRVRAKVTERPIRETVDLRQEKVRIEHETVDRPLSPEAAEKAFKTADIEMEETTEELAITKAARQIGQVNVSKNVETRQETVDETARKTEVEVERGVSEPSPERRSAKKG